jgi:N-acylneuraminate cytidylyltransferase
MFRGVPMLSFPVLAADASGLFDQIIVSTDDEEIATCAQEFGCDVFWRDQDNGVRGTQEVAREVLMFHRGITKACVIYPCTPMLVASDLTRAMALLSDRVLYAMAVQTDPLADAGMFYAGQADAWRVRAPLIDSHTLMVPMPAERCIDINTPEDWERAERMFDKWRGHV